MFVRAREASPDIRRAAVSDIVFVHATAAGEHERQAEYYRGLEVTWAALSGCLKGTAGIASRLGPAASEFIIPAILGSMVADAAVAYCREQQRIAEKKAAAEKAAAEKAAAEKAAAEKAAAEKAAAERAKEEARQQHDIDRFVREARPNDFGGRASSHDPVRSERISRTC